MKQSNNIENIYTDLRTKILTNVYTPGEKLSESKLAANYNCSRTPVREILKKLESEGLLIIKPKSGTYVKNETLKDYVEMTELRAYMESLAYSLFIRNCSERDIKKLKRINREMDETISSDPVDMMKFSRLHYEFHYYYVSRSGNDVLLRMYERLNLRSSHMFYRKMDNSKAWDTQSEHLKILEYMENRDPEGEMFVRSHLLDKAEREKEQGHYNEDKKTTF